ncbi:MAG: hypothetical protein RLZZ436_4626, partial [Planctomycetota bacterium]
RHEGSLPAGCRQAAHLWRKSPVAPSHLGAHGVSIALLGLFTRRLPPGGSSVAEVPGYAFAPWCGRRQHRVAELFTRRLPPGGSSRVSLLTSHFSLLTSHFSLLTSARRPSSPLYFPRSPLSRSVPPGGSLRVRPAHRPPRSERFWRVLRKLSTIALWYEY